MRSVKKGKIWITLCENPSCDVELGVDHVTLITTAHVRRFCSVECIAISQVIHHDRLFNAAIKGDFSVLDED